jgi:hypothetical protein
MCVSDLQSVVPSGVYKRAINPFPNPNPIYSHTPKYVTMPLLMKMIAPHQVLQASLALLYLNI